METLFSLSDASGLKNLSLKRSKLHRVASLDTSVGSSLKEVILLRKQQQHPGSNITTSLVEAKELHDISVREKLLHNQRKLQELLSEAPDAIVRSRQTHSSSRTKTSLDVTSSTGSFTLHLPEKSGQVTGRGSVYSHTDESSSDDDVRNPSDESPPNLSDNESLSCTMISPKLQRHNNVIDFRSRPSHFKEVTNVTSSQSNVLANHKQYHQLPINDFYHSAKPRPLRRPVNQTRLMSDNVTSSSVVKLPYVSRGTPKEQLQRKNSGNDTKAGTCDVTVAENKEVKMLKSETSLKSSMLEVISREQRDQSKQDTSVIRRAMESGKDSRCDEKHDSSLSKESLALFKSLAPQSDHRKSEIVTGKGRDNIPKDPRNADKEIAKNDEEDDVFPITSWVESEINSMLENECGSSRRNELSKQKLCGDAPGTSQSKEVHEISRNDNTGKMNHVITARNSVSMVEPTKRKNQVTSSNVTNNSVVLRFPGKTRSKKDAASRNSRAFALQSKSEIDVAVNNQSKPRKEVENEVRRAASLSPKVLTPASQDRHRSSSAASLIHLQRINGANTISTMTGRYLSEENAFFRDDNTSPQLHSNKHRYQSTQSVYNTSTWSLDPTTSLSYGPKNHAERKASLRHRLKGAFSFQNIRKAISMEKLGEDDTGKHGSHTYLNEYGEDISRTTETRSAPVSSDVSFFSNVLKPPSFGSVLNTVRMRKRKSRERRAAKARNTIAIDHQQVPEYDVTSDAITASSTSRSDDVSTPGHFRPIGKVLQMDARQGTLLVEMTKPSAGPLGFCLTRTTDSGSVYISSLNDNYPDKMYAGLMRRGDEIVEVNGVNIEQLPLNRIYDIIFENKRLLLRIKPLQVNSV